MLKQLLNSAFVSCEELWRSHNLLDLHNSSLDTQPHSLIAETHKGLKRVPRVQCS